MVRFSAASAFSRGAQRSLRFLARRGCFDALIEDHGNVRTEGKLNLRSFFRRKEMLGAVEMEAEAHALIAGFSQLGEAEDLITAGIGEDGARPGHELMQPAELADEFVARTQIEMIGVCEDNFRAEFFERFLGQGFDGSLRAHGHEERSLDGAVGRGQAAAARAGRIGSSYVKRKTHKPSLSEENPRNHGEE